MALITQNLLPQHLAVVNESEVALSKRHGSPEHRGDCFATRVVSELPTLVNPHEDTHESHLNRTILVVECQRTTPAFA